MSKTISSISHIINNDTKEFAQQLKDMLDESSEKGLKSEVQYTTVVDSFNIVFTALIIHTKEVE